MNKIYLLCFIGILTTSCVINPNSVLENQKMSLKVGNTYLHSWDHNEYTEDPFNVVVYDTIRITEIKGKFAKYLRKTTPIGSIFLMSGKIAFLKHRSKPCDCESIEIEAYLIDK